MHLVIIYLLESGNSVYAFKVCFNYLGFQLEEWYVCMDFTLLKGLQAKSMLFKLTQERHHMHFLVRNYHAAFSRFEHQQVPLSHNTTYNVLE